MGRPTQFLITKPHPSPRFRDKIKLLQFRRSPTDDRWDAIFFRTASGRCADRLRSAPTTLTTAARSRATSSPWR